MRDFSTLAEALRRDQAVVVDGLMGAEQVSPHQELAG
jgi:hypothetical protein